MQLQYLIVGTHFSSQAKFVMILYDSILCASIHSTA